MKALRQPKRRRELGIKLEVREGESVRQVFDQLKWLKCYWGPRYHRRRCPHALKPSAKRRNKKDNSRLNERWGQSWQRHQSTGLFEVFVSMSGLPDLADKDFR